MLATMIGMLALLVTLIFFAYKIFRNKKSTISWVILTGILFFLIAAILQSLKFLNLA